MQELKAKPRNELGKKAHALRGAGFLPAVVYGEGVASAPISVPAKDFEKVYRAAGESTLVKLDLEGKEYNVLIHDVALDPLKDVPTHADFYAVRMDKLIRTKVPVLFVGESPAVKSEGAILVKVLHELEIEALPSNLPHDLKADISRLETLESKLFVKDISLPQGVKIFADTDDIVAIAESPRSAEELDALAVAPVAETIVAVETEREAKQKVKEAKDQTKEQTEAGEAEE